MNHLQLISFVLFIAFSLCSASRIIPSQQDNGTEVIPDDEAANIEQVLEIFSNSMANQYSQGLPYLRQAHVKQHGCARAYLTVEPGLPEFLAHGVFDVSSTTTYPVIIRFSNGVGRGFSTSDPNESDLAPDTRGFAVKLFQVPGTKLVQPDAETQDFLFTTSRNGFMPDGDTALSYFTAVAKGNFAIAAFLALHPSVALAYAKVGIDGAIFDLLTANFWIQASARIGYMASKMSLTPCGWNPASIGSEQFDSNFLRTKLMAALNSNANLCFNLSIQIFQDEDSTPVENPMVQWNTPFYPVATLNIITPQSVDSDGQEAFCRSMSFNPWNSLEAHQPLGFTQRFRRIIYSQMSSQRHQYRGETDSQPTYSDWLNFPNM